VSWADAVILFFAGTAAGIINTVVGSGSLVTFPILVALGYPPVVANVTNNIGVLPGSISGALAYRKELAGHWRELVFLATFSAIGGLIGALLLLSLPTSAFQFIVPILIVVACVLVIVGPWLKRWSATRQRTAVTRRRGVELSTAVGLTGIYGGYFGAAQGVILLASLTALLPGDIQRANAFKNVLAATANFAAAIVFVITTRVAWPAALAIAIGAILGGQLGGVIGRRLSATVFRILIVAIGAAAVIYFLIK
jgi:uncharacterized membrane protein YfcA